MKLKAYYCFMNKNDEETYAFANLKSAYQTAWHFHRKGIFTSHIIKVYSDSIYGAWVAADKYLLHMRYDEPSYTPECVVLRSDYFKNKMLKKYGRCANEIWDLYDAIRHA